MLVLQPKDPARGNRLIDHDHLIRRHRLSRQLLQESLEVVVAVESRNQDRYRLLIGTALACVLGIRFLARALGRRACGQLPKSLNVAELDPAG